MTVTQVSSAPSRSEYDEVAALLGLEADPPAGLIVHAASVTPSGEVQIVDVWESAEQLAAFAEQRLFPAFGKAGILDRVMTMERPQAHEAFHVVRGQDVRV